VKFTPKIKSALLILLFILPLLSGLLGKVMKSNAWFGDYKAIACGAQKLIEGGRLYDLHLACEGLKDAAVYVYLPIVAEIAAFGVRYLGQDGLFYLYTGLYLLSLLTLFWFIYFPKASQTPPSLMQRLPFAAFLTGSAVVWGNIAVICHAAILASALISKRYPWVFIGVVAICGSIKPVFLTYLLVVLLLDIDIRYRLLGFIAGSILGLLPTLLFATDQSQLSKDWHATLHYFVYNLTPGETYYGWLSLVALKGDTVFAHLGYLMFLGLMTLSGLSLAEGLKLKTSERIWLGLSLGTLMIPRLMSQDVFLIGVGLLMIALNSHTLKASSKALLFLKNKGITFLTAACVFCLLGNALDLGDYTTKLSTLSLSLYVMIMGLMTFSQTRDHLLSLLRLKKPKASLT
jgi:hypothetical protein